MTDELRAVQSFWQMELPQSFVNFYETITERDLPPYEFLSPEEIARGAGRSYGMLPQYLPFARTEMGDGLYGFFLTPQRSEGALPVAYWDEEEMFLRPVSTDFDAFLRHCVLTSLYESQEDSSVEIVDKALLEKAKEFVSKLGLIPTLITHALPENDRELCHRLAGLDPHDSASLCHLGCAFRSQGEEERALDFFHRASEATTWFGDPAYLHADLYRLRGNNERACQGWWQVVNQLIPLCTRTWEWDLGEDHPDAEIYEIAADALIQFGQTAAPQMKSSPLWRVVTSEDPYDPDVREELAGRLRTLGDADGFERELLNALSLCLGDRGKQPERIYDALQSLYEQSGRARESAIIRFDRTLPRSQR